MSKVVISEEVAKALLQLVGTHKNLGVPYMDLEIIVKGLIEALKTPYEEKAKEEDKAAAKPPTK